tara:strand:+ start:320 stop:829 length:510 start_codon:yes stop_codon:yes gene_type:complete
MKNDWIVIDGFTSYEINSNGDIRSIKTNRILTGGKDRNGYHCVNLRSNNKTYFRPRHRLVALNFIDKINGKEFVNHKDGNKSNNSISNLEWCNSQENNSHMKLMNGTYSKLVGVSYCKTRKKYSSSLKVNGKQKFLGRFDNEIDAHKAYLDALKYNGIENKYATSDNSI